MGMDKDSMGKVVAGNNKADKANCCRSIHQRHHQGMGRHIRNRGVHSRIPGDRSHRSQIPGDVGIHPCKPDTNIELVRQLDMVQEYGFVLA